MGELPGQIEMPSKAGNSKQVTTARLSGSVVCVVIRLIRSLRLVFEFVYPGLIRVAEGRRDLSLRDVEQERLSKLLSSRRRSYQRFLWLYRR